MHRQWSDLPSIEQWFFLDAVAVEYAEHGRDTAVSNAAVAMMVARPKRPTPADCRKIYDTYAPDPPTWRHMCRLAEAEVLRSMTSA